jgi:hypothetical protein
MVHGRDLDVSGLDLGLGPQNNHQHMTLFNKHFEMVTIIILHI